MTEVADSRLHSSTVPRYSTAVGSRPVAVKIVLTQRRLWYLARVIPGLLFIARYDVKFLIRATDYSNETPRESVY